MTLTAATFIPNIYNFCAFFNLKQLSSVYVVPIDSPSICVCTEPLELIVHKSELLPLPNWGAMALGGGICNYRVSSHYW